MEIIERDTTEVDVLDQDRYKQQVKGPYVQYNGYKIQGCEESEEEFILTLGPNEVFFDIHGPRCKVGEKSKDKLNQGKFMESIAKVTGKGQTLYWPFYTSNFVDNIDVDLEIDLNDSNPTPVLQFILDDDVVHTFEPEETDDNYCYSCSLLDVDQGFHTLRLKVVENKKRRSIGLIKYVKLTSKEEMFVVRERWRPLAAHGKLHASGVKRQDAWVVHMEKIPSMGCFCPVSSRFGYWGPILKADGSCSGWNMSAWIKGVNGTAPPRWRWSRILAAHPGATFSEFGIPINREGVGVKLRGGNPVSKPPFVFTQRIEVDNSIQVPYGKMVNFHCHYWDDEAEKFKLFGIVQKHFMSIKSISIPPFIEIPGVAESQRTNHISRTILYEGMCRNGNTKKWHRINSLTRINAGKDFTNKKWEVLDGKLAMSAGGLEQNDLSQTPKTVKYEPDKVPLFFKPEKLAEIEKSYAHPEIKSITKEGSKMKISLNIKHKSKSGKNKVIVYAGNEDGLSIIRLWKNKYEADDVPNGLSSIRVPSNTQNIHYRILVKNEEIQLWNKQTFSLNSI